MKKIISLALVLILIFSLVACTSQEKKPEETPTDNPSEVESTDKTHVRYIILRDTLENFVIKNGLDKKFQEQHPEIELEFVPVEYTELDNQILMAHMAGTDFDVIQVDNLSLSQFVSGDILYGLNSFVESSEIDFSFYPSAAIEMATISDELYAVPYDPDCRVFAYNKKIFEELKLDPPETLEDMLAVAPAIREAGYYVMAGEYSRSTYPVYDVGCFMLSEGAHIYERNDEGKYVSTINTPEMESFLTWMQEMYQYMLKDINTDDNTVRALMAEGKVAMYWWGPWEYSLISDTMENPEDIVLSLMPTGKAKSGSTMGGYMFGIGSGTKNPEAAQTVLSFFLEPENMAQICAGLPADSRAYEFPPYNDAEKYAIFNEQLKSAEYPVPPTSVFAQVAESFNTSFMDCLTGKLTPKEACEAAHVEVQKYLDEVN